MLRRLICLFLLLAVLLTGCAKTESDNEALTIAATTYPVYCLTLAVCQGVDEVDVCAVINQEISCLHDYTLSVNDMKAIEGADLIVMNGLGLEEFMTDALQSAAGETYACSDGIELIYTQEGEADPHIWLDPERAALMVENIGEKMAQFNEENAEIYKNNAQTAAKELRNRAAQWRDELSVMEHREIVSFHDGFEYFADAFDLTVLRSIEEEAGSEASAKEIAEIVQMIKDYDIKTIFTEKNGSTSTADAIARELDDSVEVAALTMIMSGEIGGIDSFLEEMEYNVRTIKKLDRT